MFLILVFIISCSRCRTRAAHALLATFACSRNFTQFRTEQAGSLGSPFLEYLAPPSKWLTTSWLQLTLLIWAAHQVRLHDTSLESSSAHTVPEAVKSDLISIHVPEIPARFLQLLFLWVRMLNHEKWNPNKHLIKKYQEYDLYSVGPLCRWLIVSCALESRINSNRLSPTKWQLKIDSTLAYTGDALVAVCSSSMPRILACAIIWIWILLRRVLLPSQARAYGLPRCERNTWALFQDGHTEEGFWNVLKTQLELLLGHFSSVTVGKPCHWQWTRIWCLRPARLWALKKSRITWITFITCIPQLCDIVRMDMQTFQACVDGNANEAHVSIAFTVKGSKAKRLQMSELVGLGIWRHSRVS